MKEREIEKGGGGGETPPTTSSAGLSTWLHCGVDRWEKQNNRGERGGRREGGREGGEHGRAVRGHVFTSTHKKGKRRPLGVEDKLASLRWCAAARDLEYKPSESGAQQTIPYARRAGLSKETITSLGGGVMGKRGGETPKQRRENWPSPGPGPSTATCPPPTSIPSPPLYLTVASTTLGHSPPLILNTNPALPPFCSAACWAVPALRAKGV